MSYIIVETPKYQDKFLVIIEGENEDGQFFNFENVFTKEEFDKKVAKDLNEILDAYYNNPKSILCELSNDSFDFSCSDLSSCESMTGYEVIYFDENGVVYPVVMDY